MEGENQVQTLAEIVYIHFVQMPLRKVWIDSLPTMGK